MNSKKKTSNKDIYNLLFLIGRTILNLISNLYKSLIKKFRFSITFKITTVYALILTKILLLLNVAIFSGFLIYLVKSADSTMSKDFQIISSFLEDSIDVPKKNIDKLCYLDNIEISIFDENRKVIYTTTSDTTSVVFYDKFSSNKMLDLNSNSMLIKHSSGINNNYEPALVFNKGLKWNSNNVYIQITNRLLKETVYAGILLATLLTFTVVLIIVILMIGSRASRKMLKPVDTMTRTVKNISINALDTRLDVSGSQDELKDLAETFNGMLDRIQKSYEQQNQFVSDASHELRTPIAVIQGYANLLDRWGKNDPAVLEESIASIKSESDNMKNLIENLLFLARGDKNSQNIEKEDFYIDELIDEIVRETKLINNSHEVLYEIKEKIIINADRKLIKETLRIFVDNSIKYTPKGGKIKVGCYLQKNKAVVYVEDNGIGIPKEDLPNIFNRFYRADKSRTKQTGGTGLGLAIAKWIIMKHKGMIQVKSMIDVGTKMIVFLPLSS
ncbi:hypothetical protein CPJCM30710_14380 [Clostridium polyendosporum]|uniref:histidine kinase n=1 Tax=Clostridium polyendosporum TaxID=69208 RepID=A0A919VG29_9CLOT|nr:HAMP domain-containing sensor histidine kinase [Clostridium polyendosporum]GIM28772.1 hypothetical protein CPJCM30710_14380 [Clostridium polyendosporum]